MSMIGNFLAISQSQLDELLANPESITDLIYPDDGETEPSSLLDIDKAWHGIHYLLTGSEYEGDPPLSLAILGGTPVGPDVGYGSAQYLSPNQVHDVAKALTGVTREDLATRFRPEAMEQAGIYPQIWEREREEALDYVLHYYDMVVEYYRAAAQNGQAMLKFLN